MRPVIIFAGTTEGYEISRFLAEHKIHTLACVATEYGARSLSESEFLHVKAGRLTEEEMKKLFQEQKPEMVITEQNRSRDWLYSQGELRQKIHWQIMGEKTEV